MIETHIKMLGEFSVVEDVESVELDGELVVYSPSKRAYFGIQGAAAEVLTILMTSRTKSSEQEILKHIAAGRIPGERDIQLIQEAIKILINLGVVRDQ